VKVLLSHNADWNTRDESENTLLHVAALNGNNKTLRYLCQNLQLNIF